MPTVLNYTESPGVKQFHEIERDAGLIDESFSDEEGPNFCTEHHIMFFESFKVNAKYCFVVVFS